MADVQTILALEAANFSLSIALRRGEAVLETFQLDQAHAIEGILLSEISGMMQRAGLRFTDLDAIVTTAGPGSFTGIRIAMATAQGLVIGHHIPACAFSVFDWVRWWGQEKYQTSNGQHLLIALESKRQELFFATDESTVLNCTKEHILTQVNPENTVVIGSGAVHLLDQPFREVYPEMPQAQDLSLYAQKMIQFHGPDAFPCVPLYIRPADVHGKK